MVSGKSNKLREGRMRYERVELSFERQDDTQHGMVSCTCNGASPDY